MTEPFAADGELMLIDGNSLAYRAFFALPESIATAAGFPTNALYGLAAMMIKVLAEERPSRVVVCWDAPGPTFRKERYAEYKAGRSSTPDLLKEQQPHFRPMMEAFGFVNTELPGFEADDVIGTLATQAEAAGTPVVILTGDRDSFQLVSDRVSVLATGRGVTDTTRYTPEKVEERYGIPPALMTDFRGIVGDSSDNLPGIAGIGEKGATQLIQKYGSLEEVLAHADEQTPKRKEALITQADAARLSKDLAVIVRDAPVTLDLDDVPPLAFDAERTRELRELFDRFEFSTLSRRLSDLGAAPTAAVVVETVREVRVEEVAVEELPMCLAGAARVAVARHDGRLAATTGDDVVLACEWTDAAGSALAAVLGGAELVAHDAKLVQREIPGARRPPAHDTMVCGYLLDPRRRGYPLEELCEEARIAVSGADEDPAARDAALVWLLAVDQERRMGQEGVDRLAHEVELPLIPVLADMERIGIRLDIHVLAEIAGRVREQVEELRDRIWELAGGEFVIDSPKQLGEVLFERLGLPTFRKGKTGWSTDRQVLKLLESKHPIVGLIGQYRELTKLDNTYLSALPALVAEDGRLHTTFNQTVAETGRLSSTNPNLQNIPVRTPLGREIRGGFVADDGWRLVSLDYSQVELRILAHCSGEPVLSDALRKGDDVHRITAAEVFGLPLEDVDRTTRDRAKAVNFGIIYGISDFGLSEQLSIPRAEAAAYIDAYLARYPLVRRFIDTTIADAARDGFVTTLLGRRRPIPELAGRTQQQRNLGERLAVNTVIQGSAADFIKVAMIRAHAALADAGLEARLVLQIHDELLVEAPAKEVEAVTRILTEAMVGAADLDPPLAVDVGVGESWLGAKA